MKKGEMGLYRNKWGTYENKEKKGEECREGKKKMSILSCRELFIGRGKKKREKKKKKKKKKKPWKRRSLIHNRGGGRGTVRRGRR